MPEKFYMIKLLVAKGQFFVEVKKNSIFQRGPPHFQDGLVSSSSSSQVPLLQDLCLSRGGRHGLGQVGPVDLHHDGHDDHHDQNGHDAGLVDDQVALDFMTTAIMLIMMIMHRRPYHKKCVKCVKCNKPLTPATLNEHQTQLYCLVFTDVNIITHQNHPSHRHHLHIITAL